jgi:hypothetical protein
MDEHLDGYSRLLTERITSPFSVSAFYATVKLANFPDTAARHA